MKKLIVIFFLFILAGTSGSYAQEEEKISLNGYISTLMSSMFEKLSDPFMNDNVLHNRLNFKSYMNSLTFGAEFRNRLFTGDMVRSGLSYAEITAHDQGLLDMSWNIADEHSFFLNTTIDRLWLDLALDKFQVTVGRQRINWGQTLVWNPNDIFNAYSYFDFDYIERPGSDAIRLQYFTGASSAIELAVKADRNRDITAAALWRFNRWGYDIQLLAGVAENDEFVAGLGWSGAIGAVSFRGEGTWFSGNAEAGEDGTALFTAGFDKSFSNNSYAQVQFMLASNPFNFSGLTTLYSRNISVKQLAFSKFSAFGGYSYPVTPLFTAGISGMWFPDLEGFFSGLTVDYSASENIGISVLWQHFNGVFGQSRNRMNIAYIRIKFNF
jgi:hypothetical protein